MNSVYVKKDLNIIIHYLYQLLFIIIIFIIRNWKKIDVENNLLIAENWLFYVFNINTLKTKIPIIPIM